MLQKLLFTFHWSAVYSCRLVTSIDAGDTVEKVSDFNACLCHYRRQLLPQLEFLSDDYHAAEVLQGRFSL